MQVPANATASARQSRQTRLQFSSAAPPARPGRLQKTPRKRQKIRNMSSASLQPPLSENEWPELSREMMLQDLSRMMQHCVSTENAFDVQGAPLCTAKHAKHVI